MPTIIYASPHQAILNLLRQQPHFHFLCLVEQRDHLKAACDHFQPDILLVDDQLKGDVSTPLPQLLIDIKQQHPTIHIIYLAGPNFLARKTAQKELKQLAKHHLYNIHLTNELDEQLLLRYFHEEFTLAHLEEQSGLTLSNSSFTFSLPEWKPLIQKGLHRLTALSIPFKRQTSQETLTPDETIDFEASYPQSDAFDLNKSLKRIPSKKRLLRESSFKCPTLSLPNLTIPSIEMVTLKQGLKRYGPPTGFVLMALFCFYFSAKPILDAKQGVNSSIDEWESLKASQEEALIPTERPVVEDSQAEFNQQKENQQTSAGSTTAGSAHSKPASTKPEETLLGLIKISEKGKYIGIRPGTSEAALSKGAGLDESGVSLGEKGNTIIYGHREEVFWDLKNIKIGDLITLETLSGTLTYKVVNTRVTYPQDTSIYDPSSKHKLTLITCHPFVYMGPTPERFVVEAELVNNS